MQHTIQVESFTDYIECVTELFNGNKLWFRGHANEKLYRLVPSAMRGKYTPQEERYFTHDFYRKVMTIRKDSHKWSEYASWLTLMQHYRLPTRLLDWSRSPLIACYFATSDLTVQQEDCCIWVLNPGEMNKQFGFGSYLYPMDKKTVRDLLLPAFEVGSDGENYNIELEPTYKVIACWATEYDIRVYAQQSAFTVHDYRKPLEDVEGSENWLQKILIPKELKCEFAYKLKLLGFEYSDIFPDMENVAKELIANISQGQYRY